MCHNSRGKKEVLFSLYNHIQKSLSKRVAKSSQTNPALCSSALAVNHSRTVTILTYAQLLGVAWTHYRDPWLFSFFLSLDIICRNSDGKRKSAVFRSSNFVASFSEKKRSVSSEQKSEGGVGTLNLQHFHTHNPWLTPARSEEQPLLPLCKTHKPSHFHAQPVSLHQHKFTFYDSLR